MTATTSSPTTRTSDLRVAVLGVGVMGSDHVRRLAYRTHGASPVVVADAFVARAHEVADAYGIRAVDDPFAAITDDEVDAVLIATPGNTHEKLVLAALEAGKPVLCEKPLTTEPETALAIVRAEQAHVAAGGSPLIQVGFMRRFDTQYAALKALIDSGDVGAPLMLHCVHRNPAVPPSFTEDMMINDSVVHEVDVARFLLGEEIAAVTVLKPAPSARAARGLSDPQLVLLETSSGRLVDVEIFATSTVAYEVRTELVAEGGTALIGLDSGVLRSGGDGRRGRAISPGFLAHFTTAYDTELDRWVAAAKAKAIDGPGAWDGYAAAAVCAAGVLAQRTPGQRVPVELAPQT